ncbi:hypothetical protein [Clostridium sp. KNHs205]|jgi:uncharacterized protein YqhQ|uniref:hypothetical protein n=1 Tax=Clostridium sp. KNHs205 TaxID=1449050 RepID=UPI00051BB641|nr:hypothetical protein [Clostridium sp. KNHs205]
MKNGFSNKQIEIIKEIVADELQDKNKKQESVIKSVVYLLISIVCSIGVFLMMPKLINKGANKIYKNNFRVVK